MKSRRASTLLTWGLGGLVGGIGLLFLVGLWISTQRELALWEALQSGSIARWLAWDRWYVGWVYGFLGGLVGLSLGVGFYWLRSIGGGLSALEARTEALTEGAVLSPPALPLSAPAELFRMAEALTALGQLLARLEALAQSPYAPSLKTEDLPPALRKALSPLEQRLLELEQRRRFLERLTEGAQTLIRLSYASPTLDAYLRQATSWLVEHSGAFVGGFYQLKERQLVRLAGYAYPSGAPSTFLVGEGWVGQVALSSEALWLYPVFAENTALSSLAQETRLAMAFLPVIAGQTLLGVWEAAAFAPWGPEEQAVLEGWLFFFGAAMERHLLTEARLQLASQNEALTQSLQANRQQNEQLTQELTTLSKQNALLTSQLTEREQLLQSLKAQLAQEKHNRDKILSELGEVVVLFEASGRPRYMSPSVRKVLGYEPEALEAFFRPVHKGDSEKISRFFSNLLSKPREKLEIEFQYRHQNGELLWLEMQAENLLDEPGLEAILAVIRNITDKREFEKQYRTRIKFQSLVEHAPDMIWRLDRNGQFLYVNPIIEQYTGYPPTHYIRNTIYSVGFSMNEVQFWRDFIERVFSNLEIQMDEIAFPSVYGERRMAVRGIPELGQDGLAETVVVLLQDITELRQAQEQLQRQNIELESNARLLRKQKQELEEKNRDIMESITYAKRIQEAILPAERVIHNYFEEGFVLHLLRDLVGGDFYWVGAQGERVYVAVVDCTGHGVPGAFMALLGHTFLEAAILERKLTDPAAILGYMEQRLRQMIGEDTQDGMDAAICVFEPKRRFFHFAGAHRPLFFYHEGRWQLIAGAPAGLGGASWLDPHKVFTTTTFYYAPGDCVYLYTDGYPDQFGADSGRRLGHRRFRELLMDIVGLPMSQQKEFLETHLHRFRGELPQTDDITVLGLRL